MSAFTDFKQELLRHGLEYFNLYYGTYEGIVVDNNDPDFRGRLQIKCPAVWGKDDGIKRWILPRGVFSGKKIGFHAMPQNGDVVWITFRGGKPDPDYALWEYGWWTKDQAIVGAGKDIYILATPKGHTWVIDEASDTIYFSFKDGKAIEIKSDKINIGTIGGAAEPAVLGDKNEDALNELAAKVDLIYTAITGAAPTPGDGGAALKAAMAATLSGGGFPISTAFGLTSAATKSSVVQVD